MNLEQPHLLKIFYEVTHMKKDRAGPSHIILKILKTSKHTIL